MADILTRIFNGEAGRGVYILGGVTIGAITAGTVYLVLKRVYTKFMMAGETDRSSLTDTDVIYLFIPPRLGVVPNISPFALKLESWFRLVGLPFKVVETLLPSANEQFPYIKLNGEDIADTRFIVEKVSEHFGKPMYPLLKAEERAASVAFSRMLEENTFFTYVWYRYVCSPEEYWPLFEKQTGELALKILHYAPRTMKRLEETGDEIIFHEKEEGVVVLRFEKSFPRSEAGVLDNNELIEVQTISTSSEPVLCNPIINFVRRKSSCVLISMLKKKLWEQGTARLSPVEIYALAETDLKALSDYLGSKDYFFGDCPSLLDCVAFAHLTQILLLKMNFPPRFYVIRECKNLVRFVDRMKVRIYPDWDDLCNI